MAGTITVSTISDGVNSTSSTNCIQGSAKAWVLFDGTVATPTVNGNYNVSSITKRSTGQYTVNFTNAVSSATYSVVACGGVSSSVAYPVFALPNNTSSAYVNSYNIAGSAFIDQNYISAAVFR